jgi:hypothetical protein
VSDAASTQHHPRRQGLKCTKVGGLGGVAALGRCLRNHTIAAGGLGEVERPVRPLNHVGYVTVVLWAMASPTDAVTLTIFLPRASIAPPLICWRRRSANRNALPRSVSRSNTTNSSPPKRATLSTVLTSAWTSDPLLGPCRDPFRDRLGGLDVQEVTDVGDDFQRVRGGEPMSVVDLRGEDAAVVGTVELQQGRRDRLR